MMLLEWHEKYTSLKGKKIKHVTPDHKTDTLHKKIYYKEKGLEDNELEPHLQASALQFIC